MELGAKTVLKKVIKEVDNMYDTLEAKDMERSSYLLQYDAIH